jgi:hypothetical protein
MGMSETEAELEPTIVRASSAWRDLQTDAANKQWLRQVSLKVGKDDGQALDFADFHITFNVKQFEIQSPNIAVITVYNVGKDTAKRLRDKEFTKVVLEAGYPSNKGVIFQGTLRQARYGRINATDTYLEINAADGDIAYNFSVVNITLAAGSTGKDVLEACAKAMAVYGITLGPLPADLPELRLPRARVLWGMTRDVLRQVCAMLGLSWSIQNLVLTFIPQQGYLAGNTVELSANSGMVGIPEQTQEGIMVRCLLNPQIYVGGLIRITNKTVNQARLNLSYLGEVQNAQLPNIDENDGEYRVLAIDYTGDNRGQEWYCDLTCLTLDATLPLGQAARGRVISTTSGAP